MSVAQRSVLGSGGGLRVLRPQLRRTSEVRYHSDVAPGRRFVFVGRVIDPVCRLYIVGREIDQVPTDQPEWLEDHRHNCPTFYVLIGRSQDLTGLSAEIVIEGHRFIAESPSAIMLPRAFMHRHRLIQGGGWSFHVNVRPDYEESLMDPAPGDSGRSARVRVESLYRSAEFGALAARRWETESGAIAAHQDDVVPALWTFIDPDQFEAPGVRLHAYWLSAPTRGRWKEAVHRHASDEVTILLSDGPEPLTVEATSETVTRAESPISLYVPAGVAHGYGHAGGAGLALKFLRLERRMEGV
jgi:hypothetical protein